MIDQVSRIYGHGGLQPVKPTSRPEKKSVESTRNPRGAERLLPDLHDRVEISDEGLEASKTRSLDGEPRVPAETTEAIRENWYAVGYRLASKTVD